MRNAAMGDATSPAFVVVPSFAFVSSDADFKTTVPEVFEEPDDPIAFLAVTRNE